MKSLLILLALCAPALLADPCGMVPPISIVGPAPQIERSGLQKTYVFFKDGIETFAVRPGFTGNVDNFGMLIPVPSMPSIRKIHDDTFAHIAAAIDPPNVKVWNVSEDPTDFPNEDIESPHPSNSSVALGLGGGVGGGSGPAEPVVHLLKEEAVGMYQVVVLEAGNAEVLAEWMTKNGYHFPEGMDGVCNEYVKAGWLFVAVKAKVGSKSNSNPSPGAVGIDASRDDGSKFAGHVQGMAFRFATPELVVPMRLSSYNEGDTHNIVYVLTDKPTAIKDIPQKFVRRQVSGERLYLNLTQLLPLKFIDCTRDDFSKNDMKALVGSRNPDPHNGLARELFAADLLAVQNQELEQDFELLEKGLLNISEALELRGELMDDLHRSVAREKISPTLNTALLELLDMTLTVIDGDFPRETLRRDNLQFVDFQMPSEWNSIRNYNAHQPDVLGYKGYGGWTDAKVESDALNNAHRSRSLPMAERVTAADMAVSSGILSQGNKTPIAVIDTTTPSWVYVWLALKAILIIAFVSYLIRRRHSPKEVAKAKECSVSSVAARTLMILFAVSIGLMSSAMSIEANKSEQPMPEKYCALSEHEIDDLIQSNSTALIVSQTSGDSGILAQGWGIVGLSKIGGEESRSILQDIHFSTEQPDLARTWALAALVQCTNDAHELAEFIDYIVAYPMLAKPIAEQFTEMKVLPLEVRIKLFQTVGWRRTGKEELKRLLLDLPALQIVQVMFSSDCGWSIRRLATSYLAYKGQSNPDEVGSAMIEALLPEHNAESMPWGTGALWIPLRKYTDEHRLDIVVSLVEWAYIATHSENIHPIGSKIAINAITNVIQVIARTYTLHEPSKAAIEPLRWLESNIDILGSDRVRAFLVRQKLTETIKGKRILAKLEGR